MSALWRVDYDAGRLVIAPDSPNERVFTLPDSRRVQGLLRSVEVYPQSLRIGLPDGAEAVVEMGEVAQGDALRAGRPIVYLDQNHWSTMGTVLSGGQRVAPEVARAASWLSTRAIAGDILLPISAGRIVETVALYGERRQAVANALLRCSRGWQMRNPQTVRQEELLNALAGLPRGPVFAPAMADTLASSTDGPEQRVSWALALYETLLESPAIEDPGNVGAQAKDEWAGKWVPIADALRRDGASPATVAAAARANLLLDAADDIVAVQRALTRPVEKITEDLLKVGVLEAQPMFGLMLQVLTTRLHNADQHPDRGDLFDFVYLTCAAGYANVLVGERRMIGYLRSARRPAPRAALAASLPEAVPLVEAALAARTTP